MKPKLSSIRSIVEPLVSSGAEGAVAAAVKAKGGARLVKGPLTNQKQVPVIKPSKSNAGKKRR